MAEGECTSQKGRLSNHTKLKAYLLCYVPSPLFPAHWSLWIPYDGNLGLGIRIHVTGDALNGFQHDFDRWYDPKTDDRHPRLIELGMIDASSLPPIEPVGVCSHGTEGNGLRVCKALELLSWEIPAPGPSLRSSGSTAAHSRVQIQNCQSWLRQFVDLLIAKGVIAGEARHVIDTAPQH
ncbi:hypothetical protein CONLIGDRAFT_324722 [Coniochaeta ligniaria NRRL 30616]|uniref:Uncharacterized protein n=1 Tax=Coniochaeta ligniaria NRRL 30616 TaxID=1408157 RepID=A0A1J7IPJ9_9PEZI|nr:hypothetical protein CONLIGDRAFT_324722 [Coniochaeta ligniaria NRRL 30616]